MPNYADVFASSVYVFFSSYICMLRIGLHSGLNRLVIGRNSPHDFISANQIQLNAHDILEAAYSLLRIWVVKIAYLKTGTNNSGTNSPHNQMQGICMFCTCIFFSTE